MDVVDTSLIGEDRIRLYTESGGYFESPYSASSIHGYVDTAEYFNSSNELLYRVDEYSLFIADGELGPSSFFPTYRLFASDADDTYNFAEHHWINQISGFGMTEFIDLGRGLDTVALYQYRSEYRHGEDSFDFGFYEVVGAERIELIDGAFILDIYGQDVDRTYRLYQAAFDRTPDEEGLRYWVGELRDGAVEAGDLPAIFAASDEFEAAFGGGAPSDEDFVDALYDNVLDRLADTEGRAFWLDAFASGAFDRADMLAFFAESEENREQTAPAFETGVWVV